MLDKRTVFILGAGASCPYGYPSGAHLREYICLGTNRPRMRKLAQAPDSSKDLGNFRKKFENSTTKSIDLFMARNPKLASVGKCIIAFEILTAEGRSKFRERAAWAQEFHKQQRGDTTLEQYLARKDFHRGDWYSYLFDRLTAGSLGKDDFPDFSDGNVSFITFNYDRSLEYFLHESFRNSFTDVPEAQIVDCPKSLKILHVYGQIAPLKWQDSVQSTDYRPEITTSLLQRVSPNIRTIYEGKGSPDLTEARSLIKQADAVFFLGFGYAKENLDMLQLPRIMSGARFVCGTAFGFEENEISRVRDQIINRLLPHSAIKKETERIVIENIDCLKLLRDHL